MRNPGFIKSLVLIVTIFAAANFAQMQGEHYGQNRQDFKGRMLDQLNLTDDQSVKIQQLRSEFQKKMVDMNAELKKKEIDLKDYSSNANITREGMVQLTKDIGAIKNSIALEKINHQMDVYNLLDDSQKKIWRENGFMRHGMGDRMERMKMKREREMD